VEKSKRKPAHEVLMNRLESVIQKGVGDIPVVFLANIELLIDVLNETEIPKEYAAEIRSRLLKISKSVDGVCSIAIINSATELKIYYGLD